MTWHVVTGGAGFIGANLVRALLRAGDRVVVVDDLSLGRREHLAGLPVPLLEADAGLRWGVWRTFTGRRFDDHVRCLGRFAHLGRKARQAWFEKGSHHEVKAKEKLQVPAGRFVFVVSGVVELEHQGTWLTSRGPVLLRTQAACELTAQEAAQTILLPDAPAAEAPVRASA